MTEKSNLPFETAGAKTIAGSEEGSVYFPIAETNDAVLALRPLVYINVPLPTAVLMLGGRIRLQLKNQVFPVMPEDKVREAFGFPELDVKSEKHMSNMVGIPITHPTAMFHFVRSIITSKGLVEKLIDNLLARIPSTATRLISKEQLMEIYNNMLDDTVPNIIPGELDHDFYVGSSVYNIVFDKKSVPVM